MSLKYIKITMISRNLGCYIREKLSEVFRLLAHFIQTDTPTTNESLIVAKCLCLKQNTQRQRHLWWMSELQVRVDSASTGNKFVIICHTVEPGHVFRLCTQPPGN